MNRSCFSLFTAGLVASAQLVSLLSSAVAADNNSDGWKPLFNGTNLDGWYIFLKDQPQKNQDASHLVQIHDGAVHMYKGAEAGSAQPFGYVATEKEYANYQLRLQYKWGEKKFAPRARTKRDAGLLYHVSGEDRVFPRCVECQIQEGDVGDFWAVSTHITVTVDPKTINTVTSVTTNRMTGVIRTNQSATEPVFLEAAKGGVPFAQGAVGESRRVVKNPLNERDGWNTVEVIVRGDTAVQIVNGQVNNRCTEMQEKIDGKWVPLTKGKIALQLEGAEVLYRNIEIRELKD